MAPAAFLSVGAQPFGAGLGDHDEGGSLGEVKSSTFESVHDRGAGGAGLFDKRYLRRLAPGGTRASILAPAGKHHVVDDQRVLARSEQLGEPYLAAVRRGLEDVVLPNETARRERPALRGDLLVKLAEFCLRPP